MSTEKRQLPRTAQRFNTVAAKFAGRRFLPVWALVRHRGRKSGKSYETPVAIIGSTSEGVYIGLPWGPATDWIRNLQAAGGGRLVWKGQVFAVTEPGFVGKAEALAAAPGLRRRLAGRWLPEDCLRLLLRPVS